MQGLPRGWRTWKFWATALPSVVALVGALKGVIPPDAYTIITSILNSFYNLARGFDKQESDQNPNVMTTTELWTTIGLQVSSALVQMQHGGIDNAWISATSAAIGSFLASRKMAAQTVIVPPPPKEDSSGEDDRSAA